MKIKCLFLCFAMAFVSCSETDERKEYGLKGNVKSYFERVYKAEKKFGKWEKGNIAYYGHNQVIFDKKGVFQEFECYDRAMNLTEKRIPIREKGKMLEKIFYYGNGNLYRKSVYTHISKNEIDFERFNSDEEKVGYGKIIRRNGRMTNQFYTKIYSDVEREKLTTVLYEYDKDGNLISEKHIEEGVIYFSLRYEYLEFDAKKNWTKRLIFDEYEPQIAIREIEYF